MKITDVTSQKIKNMSFICSLLVVSIHINWSSENTFSIGWLIQEGIADGLARIAVPFFFVASGFFLAQHFDEEGWWKREVKKRISSLVIPFLVWSIIAFLVLLPFAIPQGIIVPLIPNYKILTLGDIPWCKLLGFDLIDVPFLIPLWFVWCLFFLVLASAIFKNGVKIFKYWWLLGLFGLDFIRGYIPIDLLASMLIWSFATSGLFYFSVGIFLHMFRQPKRSNAFAITCGIIGVLLIITKMILTNNGLPFEPILRRLSLPFLLYFVWHYMPSKKWPYYLTSSSFPIFLMHLIFLPLCFVAFEMIPLANFAKCLIAFICSVLISIAISMLLRCYLPRVSIILFGGR